MRVFATKGFHGARVADVAREAGVAYGLVYHYFDSKEALLETIYRETWGNLTAVLESLAARTDKPASERLRLAGAALLRSWTYDPDLVRVLVREVARSPQQLQARIGEIRSGFGVFRRIIESGQASGEFRADLDPVLSAWVFYGGLEELLTGWVMGQLPGGEDDVRRAEAALHDLICGGLAARPAPA